MNALPAYFIPHGGGPCFFMDWDPPDTWKNMSKWLQSLSSSLAKPPKAVLVISAHWEEKDFTLAAHPMPPLIYDYYGFPPETYELKYPAPGAPELAEIALDRLTAAGISTRRDDARGFDHGVFIPFKLIFPGADIPIAQMSLKKNLDPAEHLAAGRALTGLRDEDILIVGSGMSYHNLAKFFRGDRAGDSQKFDAWLTQTATAAPQRRDDMLTKWEEAPAAREAHPREEHLLPLMVVAGAAGNDTGRQVFADTVMGCAISAYRFG